MFVKLHVAIKPYSSKGQLSVFILSSSFCDCDLFGEQQQDDDDDYRSQAEQQ